MPITPIPEEWLSAKLVAMQRQLDELSRAVGRPNDQVRDQNDNVIHMVTGTEHPVLGAKGHDVSFSMVSGAASVTDGNGRDPRPLAASQFTGPVIGDTTGTHHGDVGTPAELHSHYGDLHGNSYGFHYGAVGDATTQNQVNALNIYSTGHYGTQFGEIGTSGQLWNAYITVRGRCLAEVGQPGGPFFTTYGDVGNAANFFQLFGTIHAPSERGLKVGEQPLSEEAGQIVDAVPSATWQWDPLVTHADGRTHAGPMVDDIAEVAPWLVRHPDEPDGARLLADRDLIGVLWGALREARQRITKLERAPG